MRKNHLPAFDKRRLRQTTCGAAVLCALAVSGTARASGFQVRETSITLQGSALAGMSTLTTDASAMAYNPGSVGQYTKTTISVGGTAILPTTKISNMRAAGSSSPGGPTAGYSFSGNANPGDVLKEAIVPAAQAVFKLNDRFNLGISLTSPWGLVTEYEPSFPGRFFGLKSSIKTINVKPVIAYRFANGLAVGVGPQIQYFDAALSEAVPDINPSTHHAGTGEVSGNSADCGWVAGVNWEVAPGTRIGAAYSSAITHHLSGKIDFDHGAETFAIPYVDRDATAEVTTPQSITLGASRVLDGQWTVMADVQWTDWSSIDTLTFDFDGPTLDVDPAAFLPGSPLPSAQQTALRQAVAGSHSISEQYHWEDTWFATIGTRYQYNENLSFSGGLAFDQSPVRTEYRSVRLPDSDRYWASFGASYKVADWAAVNLGYTHVFGRKARVDLKNPLLGTSFSADYEASVDTVGLQVHIVF